MDLLIELVETNYIPAVTFHCRLIGSFAVVILAGLMQKVERDLRARFRCEKF